MQRNNGWQSLVGGLVSVKRIGLALSLPALNALNATRLEPRSLSKDPGSDSRQRTRKSLQRNWNNVARRMTVAIFASCTFFLRMKKLTILEKNRLKRFIKENGGQIAFGLYHECTHVVTDDVDALSPSHLKAIQKYQLPVVSTDFIWNSVKERRLLPSENWELPKTAPCETGMESPLRNGDDHPKEKDISDEKDESEWNNGTNVDKLRWFSGNDENIPYFPEDFEVAKYDVLEKVAAHTEYVVLELHCFQQQCGYPFCVRAHYSILEGLPDVPQYNPTSFLRRFLVCCYNSRDMSWLLFELGGYDYDKSLQQDQKQLMPTKTSEEARKIYALCIQDLKKVDFELREDFPYQAEYLASEKLQEVLLAEAANTSILSEEVGRFVELIWTETVGHLNELLAKPVTTISLNDVSRAEGILLQAKKTLENMLPEQQSAAMSEFYKIIPHKNVVLDAVSRKLLSEKLDLCQLIRDMLNVQETNLSVLNSSSLSKYRALRCKIDALNVNSEEFYNVKQLLDQNISESLIKVLQIYKVGRLTEMLSFEGALGNVQPLIHASSVCNFVGILSRGLLLPKVVVEGYGLERTDYGYLGSGIYFSNSISKSVTYSQSSKTDGTRLLVICDVALGTCWDTRMKEEYLSEAPLGYDSVHGVCGTEEEKSEFEADEFAVYRSSQVKMKYVVQFSCADDKVKEFKPIIRTELEDQMMSLKHYCQPKDYTIPNHDLLNDISAGLLDRSGNPVPLKDINIKGRILDFVAEVVVFQTYENKTESPIEAKYVFPLDDTAAVCGFEAFIKEKHIIGEVKEKEAAHQEYRDAISRGHGAYLMDQDAPVGERDIFTVSVGNLPPSTKVLIKITYITELSYENGGLSFHLPAAVAPWQQDKALNENTQDSVRKICIREAEIKREFHLEMSIEMPFKINHISSWTHQLKIKKTDCKAVVCTYEGSFLDASGFVMEILIGDAYLPRMWVEKNPDDSSEACMLVFQPEFEAPFDPLSIHGEIIICLDCSNSMAGSEIQQAKQIALCALNSFRFATRIRAIKFGTNFVEFPPNPEDSTVDSTALKEFITSATANMGNSDLWKTLHYLSLLYPTKGKRNIVLISDGHIQNKGMTLQIVKKSTQHTRIFTCGVGSTANRHTLRSLSQYGAGAFEYFDVRSKYNWMRKINSQTTRMFSAGCSSVSIKWQNYVENLMFKYAPAQIPSLFNHECLLVYGFISNCTQATLNALVGNQEFQALVSTTNLQKTSGTMIHKLAARAFIRDYEQGMLDESEMEHEIMKQQLKSSIIELSLKNSIVTQFTSFVAIEKREANEDQSADTLHVLEQVAKEDVDILPYMEHSAQYLISNDIDADEVQCADILDALEDGDILAFTVDSREDVSMFDSAGFGAQLQEESGSLFGESFMKESYIPAPRGQFLLTTELFGEMQVISENQPALQSEVKSSKLAAIKKKKQKMENICPKKLSVEATPLNTVDWPQLFELQNPDGFWEFTHQLGVLLDLDVYYLINVSLPKKGIHSLGPKRKEKLLKLIATLLVLQAIYFKQLEGLIFKSLMKLKDSRPSWALEPVKKATEWASRTNREFPAICQHLELGKDWDTATKKLLGIEVI